MGIKIRKKMNYIPKMLLIIIIEQFQLRLRKYQKNMQIIKY